jgi:XTP/dITP diphosphohydrolase
VISPDFKDNQKGPMTKDNFQLLIASGNAGKIKEFQSLLSDLPVTLRGLKEFPRVLEIEETGASFAENAILKAKGYAMQTGIPTLADDSGLEVAALNGEPGVFSARYGGENAGDYEKIAKLLKNLEQKTDRRAWFVCSIAVAEETGAIKCLSEGICSGTIAVNPSGTSGFGYDPIFIPEGFEQTFGEIPAEIKEKISHRARAMEKIIQYLRGFYDTSS